MESLQRALDTLVRALRRAVVDHGFTLLFYACGAAAARVLSAHWPLESFAGRPIGQATLEGVSVNARIGTYAQAVALFVITGAAAAYVLPRLIAWLGPAIGRALQATSICGLALLVFTAWRVDTRGMMTLLLGAQGLVVLPAVLDRLLEKRTRLAPRISDPGAYAAWIGGTGFALIVPIVDVRGRLPAAFWVLPGCIVALALALDVVRRTLCGLTRARDARLLARRSDRFIHALTPLAALAAATIARNELYLLANQHGWLAIRPGMVEIAFCALVGAWCIARAVRGPRGRALRFDGSVDGTVDIQRLVGLFTFPWIVCGTVAMLRFPFQHAPSPDFLEPANAGLMIQQWLDFGRVPFLETFGAHGFSDSFFGFVYAVLNGTHDGTWTLYDYGNRVLTALIVYHVLRAWWSSPAAAMFCFLALPRLGTLIPDYCAQIGVSVFVVMWVARKRTTLAWAAFAAWIVLVFAWRLDVGFANAIASAGALGILFVLQPEWRPPLRAAVRGALVVGAALAALYLASCASRGIDPVARFQDFRAVIGSNQAFGWARIARDRNEIVLAHVFVLPVLVMTACVALCLRWRGKADPRERVFFALVGTAFFGVYYFANYPRGLVRHTFLEGANVLLSSFALFIVAGAWRWILPERRRTAAFGAFLLSSMILTYELDFGAARGHTPLSATTEFDRTAFGLRTATRVAYQPRRIDRVETSPWFEQNAQPLVSFLQRELGPGETFLDLSNSPMLYYHARCVSPHWLNHVLLVYGEHLQRSFLAELEHYDVPIAVLPSLPALARKQGLPSLDELDGVPFQLRQYRLFEWVYARYVPATVIGRWQVWVRKDRLLSESPTHCVPGEETHPQTTPADEVKRRLFTLADAQPAGGAQEFGPLRVSVNGAAPVSAPGTVLLSPTKTCAVRVVARSEHGADLTFALEYGLHYEVAHERRTCAFPAGQCERWFWIPRSPDARVLSSLALDVQAAGAQDAFDLETLELWEFDAPACRMLDEFLGTGDMIELHHLAALWGSDDAQSARALPVLRTLRGAEVDTTRGLVHPAMVDDAEWDHGIRRGESAFRMDNARARVSVGDELLFAGSGSRRVTAVEGRDVHVEGALLDPERDGAPRVVRFVMAGADDSSTIRPRHPRVYPFEPLRDERHAAQALQVDPRAGAVELKLRLRGSAGDASRLIVGYGEAERPWGRFLLRLEGDDLVHDYVVRLSVEYNWQRVDCDWIRLLPVDGPVDVLGAWITAAD